MVLNHVNLGPKGVAICGGGLVGCLLAIYLRKHGFDVSIYESREDPRRQQEVGRSINLVITSRGLHALTSVDEALAAAVMEVTTRVDGRTLHDDAGNTTYQAYGPTSSFCNFSVSRWELNKVLMNAAEAAGCQMHFRYPLQHVDVDTGTLYFYMWDKASKSAGCQKTVTAAHVFGADGGGSRCRQALVGFLSRQAGVQDAGVVVSAFPSAAAVEELASSEEQASKNNSSSSSDVYALSDVYHPLGYGYKELRLPAAASDGSYALHKDSLHIWPRGSHFLMGLANRDGSFTVTLYMHEKNDDAGERKVSFEQLVTREAVEAFFAEYYPTALKLMPQCVDDFLTNPVGRLGTLFVQPWVHQGKFALIGDASHAFTPFFGQGCNSGFEDVSVLNDVLTQHESRAAANADTVDMAAVLAQYYVSRKPNTDAIALMALDNFDEMMAKTADPRFLLEKDIEIKLAVAHPDIYTSRYALITHSLLPYRLCQEMGVIQQAILSELSEGLSSVEDVNMTRAAELVKEKLAPFLAKHNITPEMRHYTSKYYDA